MRFVFWILLAGVALAQTVATPPPAPKAPAAGTSPPAPGATPPGDDKTPAAPKPADTFQSAMEKQRAAIAIQRESVRKQVEMAAQLPPLRPPAIESPEPACDPIADVELTPLIARAAQQHKVDSKLIRGVIEQESAFRPCAVSAKGAQGLMQLMPETADRFKVGDVFDPQQNIEAGVTYIKQLIDKYKGDLKLVLAAYNSGPTTVDKTGGIPDIKETRDYVETIMKKIQ